MNKAKVTANAEGNVIVISQNNPEYGYIRIEQKRAIIDDNGFLKIKTISALLPGKVSDLRSLGWIANQEIDGKIIIKEQLKPFNSKDPNQDVKVAGDTKIICSVDGQPIYRKAFFTMGNAEDTLVRHTNIEEIRAAYAEVQTTSETSDKIDG